MMLLAAILALSATVPDVSAAVDKAGKPAGIAQELIDEATEAGTLSGMAEACKLDWQSHYHAFMDAKREAGVNELDMVFVGAYHGAGQGGAFEMSGGECSEETRAKTQKELDANLARFKKQKP